MYKMIYQDQHLNPSVSNKDRQEIKHISRSLRQLKRQMFLKAVEGSQEPSPVDSFRSLIIDLAVEQEAKEAVRARSDSMSSGRSSRSTSFDDTLSRGDSLRSIQE